MRLIHENEHEAYHQAIENSRVMVLIYLVLMEVIHNIIFVRLSQHIHKLMRSLCEKWDEVQVEIEWSVLIRMVAL